MGTLVLSALKAVLQAVFGSLLNRFFPPKTAADQKANDLQADVTELKAEAQAAAEAPTDKDALISALKDGKVALFLFAALSLSSCESNIANGCPSLRQWTPAQEDEIAANLSTLPPNSSLIAMGIEWANLRAQIKACNNGG